MTAPNDYAHVMRAAMEMMRKEQAAAEKPRLALVTAEIQPPQPAQPRKPKMSKPTDHEAAQAAQKTEIAALIKESIDAAQPPPNPVYRKWHGLRLEDHVSRVHNALDAVRCLVTPSHGTGIDEDMSHIGRNQFVDLLEILNDRLGMALEIEEQRTA